MDIDSLTWAKRLNDGRIAYIGQLTFGRARINVFGGVGLDVDDCW